MSDDISMDEQSTINVTVVPVNNDGTDIDLTNATITWVASFNGEQQVKKDTDQMTLMISPQVSGPLSPSPAGWCIVATQANAAQKNVICNKVTGFGSDNYRRPIPAFAEGDTVYMKNISNQQEYCVIDTINTGTSTLTMESNLTYTYPITTSFVYSIVKSFEFQLLAGDTILPVTKTYGVPIIWDHIAQGTFPAGLSPGNIYQEDTTLILFRGQMFINPILDIT